MRRPARTGTHASMFFAGTACDAERAFRRFVGCGRIVAYTDGPESLSTSGGVTRPPSAACECSSLLLSSELILETHSLSKSTTSLVDGPRGRDVLSRRT